MSNYTEYFFEKDHGPTRETAENKRLLVKKYRKADLLALAAAEGCTSAHDGLTKPQIVSLLIANAHSGREHRDISAMHVALDYFFD